MNSPRATSVVAVDSSLNESDISGFIVSLVALSIKVEAEFLPPWQCSCVLEKGSAVGDPFGVNRDASTAIVPVGRVGRLCASAHHVLVPVSPCEAQFVICDDVLIFSSCLGHLSAGTAPASHTLPAPKLPNGYVVFCAALTTTRCSASVAGVTANNREHTEDSADERAFAVEHSSSCVTGFHKFPS